MKLTNYIQLALWGIVLLPAILSTAMERETPTQVPAQTVAPIFDIPGTLAQIRENAVGGELTNYLEMLPGELQAQLIEIINDEILGILPIEIRPEIRKYLNGRVWVDLSKQDKIQLLNLIIDKFPRGRSHREHKHMMLTIISYLLHLKDFQIIAKDPEIMELIAKSIRKHGVIMSIYSILALLNTPGAESYLKNILMPQSQYGTQAANDAKRDMEYQLVYAVEPESTSDFDSLAESLRVIHNFLNAGISPNFIVRIAELLGLPKRTLLMYAIEHHAHYEKIKLLLEKGANVNARQPGTGRTPLAIARETEGLDPRIIDLLLKNGATMEGNE